MSGVEQPGTGGGGAGQGRCPWVNRCPTGRRRPGHPEPPSSRAPRCSRPCTPGHVDDLANAWAGTGEPHWTYLPMERPEGRAKVSAVVASMVDDPGSVAYAVLVRGRAVGVLSLMRIDPPSGVIEIGDDTGRQRRRLGEVPARGG